ncbi:MAG: tRNA (guanosine(37)-N1)-methyltransferase TrmD, partial [Anaerolineae bacterium]|nr:tRNA (guanosine(37)-N1)-methyltransferase TrmD [Anaerolineae bacterium]
ESMMWKAQDRGFLELATHDIREWTTDRHRTVDDTPYGGGGGMLLKVDVIVRAVEALQTDAPAPVLLMSPQGRVFNHAAALRLSEQQRLILLCGHYEGFDERIRQLVVTEEISIGDYVLTGGELAAMVVIDAVVRQIPGVLGAEGGAERDSHADGLLEGPHYTRPAEFRGLAVPDVLKDGNHAAVDRWRRQEALRRTWINRPELLRTAPLSEEDRYFLAQLARESAEIE